MSDYPFLPIDVDAYLSATRHLSAEQHGAYLLLLMEAWKRPSLSLPDDDTMLAAWAGMTNAEWQRSKPVIMAFWTFDGRSKGWTQKRLKKERKFVQERREKKRDAAASRWNKKKKDHANADALSLSLSPLGSPKKKSGSDWSLTASKLAEQIREKKRA